MGYRKSIFARSIGSALLLGIACLAVPSQGAFAQIEHELPLFLSAADMLGRQGFVRVINRSDRAGTVRIHAIDDSGRRFGPVDLSLAANATAHFNSDDLEQGNPAKGMSGNTGSGEGNWRLKLGNGSRHRGACVHSYPQRWFSDQHARCRAERVDALVRADIQSGEQPQPEEVFCGSSTPRASTPRW